jgi:hypothetical protein
MDGFGREFFGFTAPRTELVQQMPGWSPALRLPSLPGQSNWDLCADTAIQLSGRRAAPAHRERFLLHA